MKSTTALALIAFLCTPFLSENNHCTTITQIKPFTIVLDAGHGGKDSGAQGSYTQEKDLALNLVLRLGAYLRDYMPEAKVLYTRSSDVFVPLHQRIRLANANDADLFFSVHCNSLMKPSNNVLGTETYVMGLHRAEDNLAVAKRENKAILLEQDYATHYNGYNPYSSEGHIMLSMYQNAYLSQSLSLATQLQQQFVQTAKRTSRGVKQAGFLVLREATMPAVLVEAGFLSNTLEERYLASAEGQSYLAAAMYRAISAYKNRQPVRTQNTIAVSPSSTTKAATTSPKLSATANFGFVPTKNYHSNTNSRSTTPPNKQNNYNYNHTAKAPSTQTAPSIEQMYPTTLSTNQATVVNPQVVFRVQLAASTQKINLKQGVWANIQGVECLQIGNRYKYVVGQFTTLKEATQQQYFWRKRGFPDAFVVAYKQGDE